MGSRILSLVLAGGLIGAGAARAESADDKAIAEVLGRTITAAERDNLSGIIMSSLVRDYTEKAGIVATADDIAAFVAASRAHESDQRREWRQQLVQLKKRLADPELAAAKREQIEQQVGMLDRFLGTDEVSAEYFSQNPDAIDSIDRDIAERFVRAWKVNASLYAEHGGRVIFQQAGPEPLDAYREFLESRNEAGDFRIMDAVAEAAFWNYFTNDAMHTFVTESAAGGEAMFETPWWLQGTRRLQ